MAVAAVTPARTTAGQGMRVPLRCILVCSGSLCVLAALSLVTIRRCPELWGGRSFRVRCAVVLPVYYHLKVTGRDAGLIGRLVCAGRVGIYCVLLVVARSLTLSDADLRYCTPSSDALDVVLEYGVLAASLYEICHYQSRMWEILADGQNFGYVVSCPEAQHTPAELLGFENRAGCLERRREETFTPPEELTPTAARRVRPRSRLARPTWREHSCTYVITQAGRSAAG
ncbi:hypothetical protein C8Q79DRAFT_258664 [Trametes meyenii]|nr:hypothetical protein C8Q79DRAFT_258664 [Trametes meyenii]